jgi:hypothetical protein
MVVRKTVMSFRLLSFDLARGAISLALLLLCTNVNNP